MNRPQRFSCARILSCGCLRLLRAPPPSARRDQALDKSGDENRKLAAESAALRQELGEAQKSLAARTESLEEAARTIKLKSEVLQQSEREQERLVAEATGLGRELDRLREDLKSRMVTNDELSIQLALKEKALSTAARDHEQLVKRNADVEAELAGLQLDHDESTAAAAQQTAALKDLQARLAELEARAVTTENTLTQRDVRVRALEVELGELRDQSSVLTAELQEAHTKSQSLAADLHAREAAVITLRSELAAHVEALGAIRRDINRIETGRASDNAPVPVRYLIAVDQADVVHVLNRKIMTIGRTQDSDLQIRSSHISRHHARLLVGPTAVIIEDLDSTNGCFVNGRRIRKQILQNEDILMIGKTRYRFTARPIADTATH